MRISDWSSDVCSSDLGGLTAATLFVLIATGIVLAQFYNPMPEAANASVRDIVTDVWAGQFLRGVHYWAAQAMYVLAALHLLRVFLTGSSKRPREANWPGGVAMFALVPGAIFTGPETGRAAVREKGGQAG